MTQRIEEQIGAIPTIEPEAHFFQVGWKMLRGNFVPSADDAALEQGKGRLNGIGVNVSNDILFGVADGLMELLLVHGEGIGIDLRFIGDDYFHIFANVVCHDLADSLRSGGINVEQSQFAAALADADDYLFVETRKAATGLATNVGFIDLKNAVHHRFLAFDHGRPDAMAEVPSCFVAHADRALNLASRHALLRFAEQVSREEPFCQRQVRVVEYRSRSNRKLVVAILAVEELLFSFELDHGAFAAQALRAFREAQANKQLAALVFGTKQGVYIN